MSHFRADVRAVRSSPLYSLVVGLWVAVLVLIAMVVLVVALAITQRNALRLSADCLYVQGRYNETPPPCHAVAHRVDKLRAGKDPFNRFGF